MSLEEFAELNKGKRFYFFDIEFGYPLPALDWEAQSERVKNTVKRDFNLLQEYAANMREGLKVGDFLRLPDGQAVIFSHIWEDGLCQTTPGGSIHLSRSGGLSYSGGLDSGVKVEDLIKTEETKPGLIWFWHEGSAGADRGVNAYVNFNVWETKPGTDLSGVPQVEALRKEKIREKAEKITRINGNGHEYTLPLPELYILNKDKKYPLEDCKISGLKFESCGFGNLRCQPMKLKEINRLLSAHSFKADFHNNASNKNTLFLTPVIESERDTLFPSLHDRRHWGAVNHF